MNSYRSLRRGIRIFLSLRPQEAEKTAVLVERIIRMITDPDQPVDIDRLLVMTFTNAAAAEMRERVGALGSLLDEDPEIKIWNGRAR